MTCIVGLVHRGNIYIGGDSACGEEGFLCVRKDAKVFKSGSFVYGFSGSFRMGQILRYKFKPPKRKLYTDIFEYMVTEYIDALRECFKGAGYSAVKEGVEYGGDFLVGYHGHLFEVQNDYQVGEIACDYHACGCGREIALGALFPSDGTDPEFRIRNALEAAEQFNPYVRGPFIIESLKAVEEEG